MAAVGTQLRSSNNNGGVSRLSMMQAKFREKLMIEKESRLLEMAARQEAEREDIIHRVTKSSANSLSSSMSSLSSSGAGQGRVRKLFEERRIHPHGYHQSPKGYDKSYPLDPVRRDGGRPPMRGGRSGRGISMDRVDRGNEDVDEYPVGGRSKSQAALQRANRGDNRLQRPPKGPGVRGIPIHHKSTSSLMESNRYNNGSSRGPSPAPPSSTKSSPGPRGPPVTPMRRVNNKPKPPPTSRNENSNFLSVNGNKNGENRSRSPTPTPKGSSTNKGFFAKFGLRSSKNDTKAPTKPKSALPSKTTAITGKTLLPSTPKPPPSARSQVPDNLRGCKICGRNFDPDRIGKHEQICQKAKQKAKKRKIFDPVKMRTQGTEAEKFVARGDHLKENKKNQKGNWRKKHDDFIKTVRAAKGMPGYVAPPIDTSDYVECPHCGRKFNEGAADRHIPKCKDMISNKPRNREPPPQRPPQRPPPRRRR